MLLLLLLLLLLLSASPSLPPCAFVQQRPCFLESPFGARVLFLLRRVLPTSSCGPLRLVAPQQVSPVLKQPPLLPVDPVVPALVFALALRS
jgi:hypothetical protein